MSKHHRILLGFLSLLRGLTVLTVLGAAFVAGLHRPSRRVISVVRPGRDTAMLLRDP